MYLLWWSLGVFTFGLGTLSESLHALAGWQESNVRFWYIVGALLGGFPLAQGTVYLLMPRRFAESTSVLYIALILIAMGCVVGSPVRIPDSIHAPLSGKVFEWEWVRYFSPFINVYSFLFLVGGAIYSARAYYLQGIKHARFIGNIWIAIGGLLPGIGGSFARIGYVEVLFVTEFLGLVAIFVGYQTIRKDKALPASTA